MKKKVLLGLVSLSLVVAVVGTVAYQNKHHLLRYSSDLPDFSHEIALIDHIMLPMRDGVRLETKIFMPKGEGPWPSVLIRFPYVKFEDVFITYCDLFVRYGYVCVFQVTRGQGGSEGDWEPLVNEPNDGSDTLYWMADQSWSDSNIGMWGVSYLALTQWAAMFDAPKELKTFIPISMGTDFHKSLYERGLFRHFVTWWAMVMPDRTDGMDGADAEEFIEITSHLPHMEVDEKYAGQKLDWYREWISATHLNSPTWAREDAQALIRVSKELDIPVLMFEGWYDIFFKSQFSDYENLGSKSKSRFVIGPWSHIQQVASDVVNDDVEDAGSKSLAMSLEWFEHHLKGKPLEDPAYVKTYDIGANEWRIRDEWPPQTSTKAFALANLNAANDCESGLLIKTNEDDLDFYTPDVQAKVSYTYNPEDPVMARGGSGFIIPLDDDLQPGAIFQEGYCERDDVLTFATEAMKNDLAIVGKIQVKLNVSSDAEDTAFIVKVFDVQPDGRPVHIRESGSTLALRNDAKDFLVYEPNSVVDITVDMWPIEWTIKKGHKLRIDVSSSNFPTYNIHTNFAGPWAEQKETKIAQQTLYEPSIVYLPVEESRQLAAKD